MAVSSGRFPCRPLTSWSSRLLRKLALGVVGGGELGMGGWNWNVHILCFSVIPVWHSA